MGLKEVSWGSSQNLSNDWHYLGLFMVKTTFFSITFPQINRNSLLFCVVIKHLPLRNLWQSYSHHFGQRPGLLIALTSRWSFWSSVNQLQRHITVQLLCPANLCWCSRQNVFLKSDENSWAFWCIRVVFLIFDWCWRLAQTILSLISDGLTHPTINQFTEPILNPFSCIVVNEFVALGWKLSSKYFEVHEIQL